MNGALRRKATGAIVASGAAWTLWGAAFPNMPTSDPGGYERQMQSQFGQSQRLDSGGREARRKTLQAALESDALRSAEVRRAEASGVARALLRRP